MTLESFGKVILFGEHAAVYGRASLALGLPGMRLVSLATGSAETRVRVRPWNLDESTRSENAVGRSLQTLLARFPGKSGHFEAEVEAFIPPSAGLGSSAALSVLLARTLAKHANTILENETVRRLAHEMETVFHGTPSGLDDTVATYGGLCLFRRTGWTEFPGFAKDFKAVTDTCLRSDIPTPPLVIGNSLVPRSTKTLVAAVRKEVESHPERAEGRLDAVERCTFEGARALLRKDWNALGKQFDRNHAILREFGCSHPTLETMIDLARKAGAKGAKLTGAGGGGCVVALAPGREADVAESWSSGGFDVVFMANPDKG